MNSNPLRIFLDDRCLRAKVKAAMITYKQRRTLAKMCRELWVEALWRSISTSYDKKLKVKVGRAQADSRNPWLLCNWCQDLFFLNQINWFEGEGQHWQTEPNLDDFTSLWWQGCWFKPHPFFLYVTWPKAEDHQQTEITLCTPGSSEAKKTYCVR